ncbi:MAG: hypothetical protein H7070_00135, partial [Saprospiraceae bacterium]|nr:hypothetical protein [Pyrinomonadaceae bacterium]
MDTTRSQIESTRIPKEKFLSFVSGLFDGYPDPEDPQPPGPWDPIIRDAITGLFPFDGYYYPVPPKPSWSSLFGPLPDPWHIFARRHPAIWDVIGDRLSQAGLNPQPLPPAEIFAAALVRSIVGRAETTREIIANLGIDAAERGIIIVSGRPLSGLVDDICGNVIRKPPIPDPPDWWDEDFGAAA